MKNEAFTIERTLNAPIEKVWSAISNKEEMKNWYFDLAEFKPEIGFEFEFTGGPEDGVQYVHQCKVTEAIPNKKLTYSWAYKGFEGISYVTFELFKEGDKTKIKLTHTGLETFPANNADFARTNFEAGWNEIIGRALPNYVEKK
ncbi:MAG: SRPBCC domain-containing protein [Bacteroidetes bacterium]|nr:SRPBCC domain-containing protein [Bacteroidota bacterium]